jgi:membrane protease YdiL (CAAX protease family)
MSEPQVFFVVLCAISVVMIGILYKFELLALPAQGKQKERNLALMTPLLGFLIFLGSCAFVPQLVGKVIQYTDTHGYSAFTSQEKDSFSQLIALVVSAILLMGFSYIHPDHVRSFIWGETNPVKAILKGMLYCVLTYPIVMALVQGVHLGLEWMGQKPVHEQVALSQLKSIYHIPWLFWSFACAVVTLVPLVEEFLFRGLFQNYLGGYLGPKIAILFTSLIFAAFHYASEQGSSNIELLIGLFLYSCFIGIFYMRERSIWTPIAMHASFNAITLFFTIFVLE